ncbi:hypothetical protein E2C01_037331 [Portunus trituberculatus]|uniref:Uncharacterized protein n=1 Tax=Portunus trituberculatus TaxID=210409 RepID=A0A5B7FEP2_PORTR|nr:hypothetical protein [Portunus trituberculatus]
MSGNLEFSHNKIYPQLVFLSVSSHHLAGAIDARQHVTRQHESRWPGVASDSLTLILLRRKDKTYGNISISISVAFEK